MFGNNLCVCGHMHRLVRRVHGAISLAVDLPIPDRLGGAVTGINVELSHIIHQCPIWDALSHAIDRRLKHTQFSFVA